MSINNMGHPVIGHELTSEENQSILSGKVGKARALVRCVSDDV